MTISRRGLFGILAGAPVSALAAKGAATQSRAADLFRGNAVPGFSYGAQTNGEWQYAGIHSNALSTDQLPQHCHAYSYSAAADGRIINNSVLVRAV